MSRMQHRGEHSDDGDSSAQTVVATLDFFLDLGDPKLAGVPSRFGWAYDSGNDVWRRIDWASEEHPRTWRRQALALLQWQDLDGSTQ